MDVVTASRSSNDRTITLGYALAEGSRLNVFISISPATVITAVVIRIRIPVVIISTITIPAWMIGIIGITPGIVPDSPVKSVIYIHIDTIPAVIITIPAIPVRIVNDNARIVS
jgi:hypothetical protein